MEHRLVSILLLLAAIACDPAASPDPAKQPASSPPPVAANNPPTGSYEVSVRVVSDDCQPAYVPPPPWRSLVVAKAAEGVVKVNAALAAIPPATDVQSSARSDLMFTPGKVVKQTTGPVPACASYEVKRTYEPLDPSRDGFRLAISVEFGDVAGCAGAETQRSKCTTKIEQSFRVVDAMCPAECTGDIKNIAAATADPAAKVEVDCSCR